MSIISYRSAKQILISLKLKIYLEEGTDANNYVYNLYFNPVQTAGNDNMNSVS